jgi:hypothetical protein
MPADTQIRGSCSPDPQRGRFQFSLRTFLVLILASGVVLGWLGRMYLTAREKRRAWKGFYQAFQNAQWTVYSNDDMTAALSFDNPSAIRDADLAQLQAFRSSRLILKTLDLRGAPITDRGLVNLEYVPTVQDLVLCGTQITDAGLKHLGHLKDLKTLDVSGTRITGAGFGDLEHLEHLESLRMYETQVTEEGLRQLRKLKHLKRVLPTSVFDRIRGQNPGTQH